MLCWVVHVDSTSDCHLRSPSDILHQLSGCAHDQYLQWHHLGLCELCKGPHILVQHWGADNPAMCSNHCCLQKHVSALYPSASRKGRTDTSYHEAWAPKPHHHTVHNDQHSSYMCEHCSRLTPLSPPVKVFTYTQHNKPLHHVLAPCLINVTHPAQGLSNQSQHV